ILWTSRATPQTPLSLPTLRDRADFPSCGVVASLLGAYPTASAPPCLRGEICRGRGHVEYSDRLLDAAAAVHEERHDGTDQEDHEQDFGDSRGAHRDSAKSEHGGDQRYDKK